jgi:selenocysteine lyase/cysteine desulfurase
MIEIKGKKMFSPELLEKIREKFLYVESDPYSGERVYLEASGGSLRLKSVIDHVAKEYSIPDELFRFNPASDHAVELMEKGYEDVKLFLGAASGAIIPANSATHTIFRAVSAVTSHIPGGNIVTTELEHPAVLGATRYYAGVNKLEWRMAPLSKETSSVPMEAILERIDSDTCMLCFQHASNQTGAVNDAAVLIKEARKIKPELYVLVDAVQYAPHGPIDVEAIGADAYAFGPYKAYSVKGVGFAHISERLAKLPHEQLTGKPPMDWTLGSPAHALISSWSAVVDYLSWLGGHFTGSTDRRERVIAAKEAIYAHMKALLDRLLHGSKDGSKDIEGLLDMEHVTLCGMEKEIADRMCIFLFRLNGLDSPLVSKTYNKEHRVRVSARIRDSYSTYALKGLGWPDAVRLCAAHYNTPEEIDRFLAATKKIYSRGYD